MSINHITITGRLAATPELRFLGSGKAVLNARIGHTKRKNVDGHWEDDSTTWLDVTLWGDRAEKFVETGADKGDEVIAAGRLEAREYQANDGMKRTAYGIQAEHVAIVTKKVTQAPSQAAEGADPWGDAAPGADTPQSDGWGDSQAAPF